MRGIAPCGACHGELGSKAGAAWLEGEPAVYLRTQLEAFASGARRKRSRSFRASFDGRGWEKLEP
jgi:cytochrome c553